MSIIMHSGRPGTGKTYNLTREVIKVLNRLDAIIRELVDYWYVYQNGILFFTRWEFNIDDDRQKRFPLSKKWIWKKKKFYEMYDTLEKIER